MVLIKDKLNRGKSKPRRGNKNALAFKPWSPSCAVSQKADGMWVGVECSKNVKVKGSFRGLLTRGDGWNPKGS